MLGASLSGVSFRICSRLGRFFGFTYMQMVLGFSWDTSLLPKSYFPFIVPPKRNKHLRIPANSIWHNQLQNWHLILPTIGTIGGATRLYIVCSHFTNISFLKHGIYRFCHCSSLSYSNLFIHFHQWNKTIIWTDALQTFFLLGALILFLVVQTCNMLNFNLTVLFCYKKKVISL